MGHHASFSEPRYRQRMQSDVGRSSRRKKGWGRGEEGLGGEGGGTWMTRYSSTVALMIMALRGVNLSVVTPVPFRLHRRVSLRSTALLCAGGDLRVLTNRLATSRRWVTALCSLASCRKAGVPLRGVVQTAARSAAGHGYGQARAWCAGCARARELSKSELRQPRRHCWRSGAGRVNGAAPGS